jgi:predicted deacylase
MSKTNLEVATISAPPGQGERRVLDLEFSGSATKLPLFVLNGAFAGPTLLVTAGIHGAEYVGIETAYRLAMRTDPLLLHGQLIVSPISSMGAFKKRAIYLCPPDDKNLNRMFPGNPAGSYAQQLAHWIFTKLILRADFYLDLHGGDLNEALVPFCIVRRSGDAGLDAKSLALARVMGLPYVVHSVVKGSTYAAASSAGIPAVLAEVGGQGLCPEDQVLQMTQAVQRALAHLGLLLEPVPPAAAQARLLEEMIWMRSEHDGLFHPGVKVGDEVAAGQSLGHVADYLGRQVQAIHAPAGGTILFLVTTLAMNKDDPLLAIGR